MAIGADYLYECRLLIRLGYMQYALSRRVASGRVATAGARCSARRGAGPRPVHRPHAGAEARDGRVWDWDAARHSIRRTLDASREPRGPLLETRVHEF